VEVVQRREEVYRGGSLRLATDILIRWRAGFVIRGLYIPQPGASRPSVLPLKPNLNNGGHRMYGILVVAGDDIRAGETIDTAEIIDLAPTILHLLCVPVPDDMNGKVLMAAFRPGARYRQPVVYQTPIAHAGEGREGVNYGREEAEVIKERLRGLGYIG
jgi:predicted AlkP superfamily phosphohydrolase/phosphomutase